MIPLYYTGYIRSSEVSCIQDPRWSLCPAGSAGRGDSHPSIDHCTDYHLWFNANGARLMGKIKLKCQIGDLKSEVTCYVIDIDISYNLLLGWPWIHRNFILLPTLHQVIKYADEWERVRTLIVEKYPFKGVENYFTDSLPHQILWRLIRFSSQRNPTLAMNQTLNQRQKKNVFGK